MLSRITVNNTSSRIHLPRTSEASGTSSILPTRNTFIDYFPATTVGYSGFIRTYRFEETMKKLIAACVKDTGDIRRYKRAINPNKQSNDFSERMYYQNIKEKILHRVNGTEWRMPNEMRMSEEMFAQSKAYRNAAIKGAGVEIVSNLAGNALAKPLSKYSGQTINKFIKPDTTLNKVVGKAVGKEFTMGGKVLKAEFHGVGKMIDKSVEGYAELIEHAVTNEKVKQYEGFEPEYFEDNTVGRVAEIASDLNNDINH